MPNILSDIREKGFVIFSLNKANLQNYYPGVFNKYPGVSVNALNIYDLITIKIFVLDKTDCIVDDHIDLTIESIERDKVIADILTVLPEDFPLSTGSFMELLEEEILFCIKYEGPLKGSTMN
jgi:hypothetical protein